MISKKILSGLIISTIIIVVLISIGDLGELIEQATSQAKTEDFGIVKNCNPSIAVCSVSGKFKDKKIRFSLSIDKPVVIGKKISFNFIVSGVDVGLIKNIKIKLDMPGEDVRLNQQYFKLKSANPDKLSSQWYTQLSIDQVFKQRKVWLAVIETSLDKEVIQVAFQLPVNS